MVARLLDAFFSPVIGYISDHFHRTWAGKKFGRRRFFILLAIPLVPSFALMWVEGQSFWYYLITYCFFELVYAMEIIPYETLAAEMSPDYKTKAKFAGARIICGQVANIAAMWLPGVIIGYLGGKDRAHLPVSRHPVLGVLRVRGAGGLSSSPGSGRSSRFRPPTSDR